PGPDSSLPYFPLITAVGSTVFFKANDGRTGFELWKSDGTAGKTELVKDINTSFPGASSYPSQLTDVNGTLFFSATDDGVHGELWKSDGTAHGTVKVKDINAFNLANVNGTLFFAGFDGVNGEELWKSDGTESGTVLVKDINLGSSGSYPRYLTNVNGTL